MYRRTSLGDRTESGRKLWGAAISFSKWFVEHYEERSGKLVVDEALVLPLRDSVAVELGNIILFV